MQEGGRRPVPRRRLESDAAHPCNARPRVVNRVPAPTPIVHEHRQVTADPAQTAAIVERLVMEAAGRRRASISALSMSRRDEKLRAEMARYGLKVEGWVFKDYSMSAGPMQAGIQKTARELAAHRRKVDALGQTFTEAKKAVETRWRSGGPAAVQTGSNLMQAVEAARGPWMAAEGEYRKACNAAHASYPIVATYSYGDDAAPKLTDLAGKKTEDLAESLYKTIDTRLENIKTVRSEIREPGGRYNAWKHPAIIARTKPRMALEPWEARVVDEKALAVLKCGGEPDPTTWAVIAIGLGLLSAIPTGGSGLVAGVAAGAAVLSAAYSVTVLYDHYKDYSLASAERLSTLDQAEAISQDDPSLMWLAFDLLDVGLNVVGAASAFKALRGAMVAAEKGGVAAFRSLIAETGRAAAAPVAQQDHRRCGWRAWAGARKSAS
jgi:hypothetical protein